MVLKIFRAQHPLTENPGYAPELADDCSLLRIMAEGADEASCVRNYEQEREGPARDEQPLLVTAVSCSELLRKPFLQVGCASARLYKAHVNICILSPFFRRKATSTSTIW